MRDYPSMVAEPGRVEPCPRRVRGVLAGRTVFDTVRAVYVWEWPNYPQYYIPVADIDAAALEDEGRERRLKRGTARTYTLVVGPTRRPGAVRVYGSDAAAGIGGTGRFDWDALDAWYEEDEQIFVHPRNPYTRVDAVRSSRQVRVELDGVLLAESDAPVMVYETGLPTRYYVPRTCLQLAHLEPSETVTACPYKGVTSSYWSVGIGDVLHADLAWSYDFPTRELLPITGLVAFYNELVDIFLDGMRLERPVTHFVKPAAT